MGDRSVERVSCRFERATSGLGDQLFNVLDAIENLLRGRVTPDRVDALIELGVHVIIVGAGFGFVGGVSASTLRR